MSSIQEMRSMFETIRDERRMHSNTAERIGKAFLSILPYLGEYLRTDQPETLVHLLTLLQGLTVGNAGQVTLNPDGSITCSRIHVAGPAIFDELVFNKQTVNEGDQVFSDRGIIDSVEHVGLGQYRITFRKEHDNDIISFVENDCLKSVVDSLDADGTLITSWFRVQSVNLENSTADVILYPDDEVPGGHNYAPSAGAAVARWGNPVDADRQQHFFLSSGQGVFAFLQNVTKPIINDEGSNVTAFIGLPMSVPAVQQLVQEGTLSVKDPILYAKTAVVENLITIRHDGTPDYVSREWLAWDEGRQYIKGYDASEGRYVQDDVWHGGSLWRCIVPLATIGVEPSLTNTDWACIRSGKLELDISSTEGDWYDGDRSFNTVLVAMLMHGDMVVSADNISSIVWTRESGDADADEAWNINQSKKQQTLNLPVSYDVAHQELSDIPVGLAYGDSCGFRCTIMIANIPLSSIYSF